MAKLSHEEKLDLARQLSTPTTELEALLRSVVKGIAGDFDESWDDMALFRVLAVNPNATPQMLQTLMYYVPEHVGDNPALLLLHLENPDIVSYLLAGRNHTHELEIEDFFDASCMQAINPTVASYQVNEEGDGALFGGTRLSEFKDGRVLKVHDGFITLFDSIEEYIQSEREYCIENEEEDPGPDLLIRYFDKSGPDDDR